MTGFFSWFIYKSLEAKAVHCFVVTGEQRGARGIWLGVGFCRGCGYAQATGFQRAAAEVQVLALHVTAEIELSTG